MPLPPNPRGPQPIDRTEETRLESWGEIASYLRREIRTVQRWEKTLDLPVRRLLIGKQSSVYAYRSELDQWYRDREPGQEIDEQSDQPLRVIEFSEGEPKSTRTIWRPLILLGGSVALMLAVVGYKWKHGHSELPLQTERQLTANPPEDSVNCAAISPDGRYVAYVDESGLFVRSVHSGDTRPIALPVDFPVQEIDKIRWHPNAEKLLVTRTTFPKNTISIWILPVVGEASPKKLREGAWSPAISPDGMAMVFASCNVSSGNVSRSNEIWVAGNNGENPRELLSAEGDVGIYNPVWSPDGRWIAYIRGKFRGPSPEGASLEIQPATGGGPAKPIVLASSLPPSSAIGCEGDCLCWLPDWTLVFSVKDISRTSSGEAIKNSLWKTRVDPKNGSPSQKPQWFAQLADFSPSNLSTTADGKILAFVKRRSNQDVYIGELDSTSDEILTPRRLTLDTHNSDPEAWTQDNRSFLFVSDRNGRRELFKQGPNDSVPERIVSSAAGEIGTAQWSPDGSWLLYWEYERTEGEVPPSWARLMRQPSGGGPPETVLELPQVEIADSTRLSCSNKVGNPCALSAREEGNIVFYAFDPVRGRGQPLGKILLDKDSYSRWAISPDGSQLAVIDDRHKDRIELLALSDKIWHEIHVEPGWGPFQTLTWTADGKGFFLNTWSSLVHISKSGKVKVVLNSQRQYMNRPRPSPDGKYLAFGATTVDSNVWLLENF
jgi:Tol biopolymer transport system component